MPIFGRLKVPTFDLCWLNTSDENNLLLLPGGGGSTKSGVINQIQIASFVKKVFNFSDSYETDHDGKSNLFSAISSGLLKNKQIVCGCSDNFCTIFEVKYDEKIRISRLIQFQAELETESSLNCCCILPSGGIVTAGDNGNCKIWSCSIDEKDVCTIEKTLELKGHTGAIMSVCYHPVDSSLLLTGSKDGTCRVWDLSTGCAVGIVPSTTGLTPSGTAVECRGCCFSEDGRFIFSIQSGRRGATFLIKWSMGPEAATEGEAAPPNESSPSAVQNPPAAPAVQRLSFVPCKAVEACKVPATRMSRSSGGACIAIGAADGSVTTFLAESLGKISSTRCHDLPVTGLAFQPDTKHRGAELLLVSCSADYSVAAIAVRTDVYSPLFQLMVVLLSLLLLLWLTAWTHTQFYTKGSGEL